MDIGLKTLFGRSGGETFQMKFQGEGFVVKWDGMLIDSQGCLEWARVRVGEGEKNPAVSLTLPLTRIC
jgi:hypothetical protein